MKKVTKMCKFFRALSFTFWLAFNGISFTANEKNGNTVAVAAQEDFIPKRSLKPGAYSTY